MSAVNTRGETRETSAAVTREETRGMSAANIRVETKETSAAEIRDEMNDAAIVRDETRARDAATTRDMMIVEGEETRGDGTTMIDVRATRARMRIATIITSNVAITRLKVGQPRPRKPQVTRRETPKTLGINRK